MQEATLEHVRRLPNNYSTMGVCLGLPNDLCLSSQHRNLEYGDKNDGSVHAIELDVDEQILEASWSLHPVSSGHFIVAGFHSFRLSTWHNKSKGHDDLERGKSRILYSLVQAHCIFRPSSQSD